MARELRYWDSACFLAVMKNEPQGQLCDGVIQAAEAGQVLLVTSTWTLTEVIRIKGWDAMAEADDNVIRAFFERDYIALRAVTEEIGHQSRRLGLATAVLAEGRYPCRDGSGCQLRGCSTPST